MKKILLFFGLLSFLSVAHAQTDIAQKPNIQATGVGTIAVFPDAAEITISLEHIKPALREAINENQATSEKVLNIIKKYAADSLIKTSLISTNKESQYDYKLKKEVFIGYSSSQKILFTLKNLNELQSFTEDLLKTKFKKIDRISYFNTNGFNYIKQAQELAVKDAISTIDRMANAAGVHSGKILTISTSESPNDNYMNRADTDEFVSFSKSMGGRGLSSSGQLIQYIVSVNVSKMIE